MLRVRAGAEGPRRAAAGASKAAGRAGTRDGATPWVVVSNDGWSIIRTQGYNPEVIAVSPTGDDVVRVRVTDRPPVPGEKPEPPEERRYWELVRAVLVAPET